MTQPDPTVANAFCQLIYQRLKQCNTRFEKNNNLHNIVNYEFFFEATDQA